MVEIYINGSLVDSQIEDEVTIGDVLKSFEQTCEENKAAVIDIIIDGKRITADEFDEEAEKPLGNNNKFEFTVITADMIKESFTNLSSLFNELATKMENVPMELQKGNSAEVSNSVNTLANSIESFCKIANYSSLFPEEFTSSPLGSSDLENFFKDFSPILKDFEEALQNNDSVMIGDLAEYEICPRLQAFSETLKKF